MMVRYKNEPLMLILLLIYFIKIVSSKPELPNVLVLIADDLGLGDIRAYNSNSLVNTPNIDKIINEGVKFIHHMSVEATCTPSRSAFLTGRYPIRYGMARPSNGPPVIVYSASRAGLPLEEKTWANIFQDNGYDTQAVGKWHMGWNRNWRGDQEHGPLTHGFNSFFGLPFTLIKDFTKTDSFWTMSESSKKVTNNNTSAIIFSLLTVIAFYNKSYGYTMFILMIVAFLLLWFITEHFRLHISDKWWQRSKFMEKFINSQIMENNKLIESPINLKTLNEKLTKKSLEFISKDRANPFLLYHAFTHVHSPQIVGDKFNGLSKLTKYEDAILELDDSVGQILNKLDELKLRDNTIVFFTSDHGSRNGSNSNFRGGKGMGAIEGGIRIPAAIRWPKKIKGKTIFENPSSLLDFYPTILEAVGYSNDMKSNLDGASYWKMITSNSKDQHVRIYRHYCGDNLHSLRYITDDNQVFKAYFKEVILNEEGNCGEAICHCHDPNKVKSYPINEPKIIDIVNDPKEMKPLNRNHHQYTQLIEKFSKIYKTIMTEVHPESQLASFWKVMPMPWLLLKYY